jgi:hypothetical protein
MNEDKTLKCCICGESVAEKASAANTAIGWLSGNNPHPLGKEGDRACDPCDSIFVFPARCLYWHNDTGETNDEN